MKGFKFIETLKITFVKQINEKEFKFTTAHFNSKTKTIINENEIHNALTNNKEEILNTIHMWFSELTEGSNWITEEINAHHINLTKCKPLQGSSYIQLPIELRNSNEGLINIKK